QRVNRVAIGCAVWSRSGRAFEEQISRGGGRCRFGFGLRFGLDPGARRPGRSRRARRSRSREARGKSSSPGSRGRADRGRRGCRRTEEPWVSVLTPVPFCCFASKNSSEGAAFRRPAYKAHATRGSAVFLAKEAASSAKT